MKKIYSILFILLFFLIFSFSFLFKKDYFFDTKEDEVNIGLLNSENSSYSYDVLVPKYIISANTIELWVQTRTQYNDGFLDLKIYDSLDEVIFSQNNIWYIPYDESIYGEGYDPSDYSTWTSDPVPEYDESRTVFTQRWHFEIPGMINYVGGSDSYWNDYENRFPVPVDFHFQPNTSYSIEFRGKNDGSYHKYYFTTKDNVKLDYSSDLGQIDSFYKDSNGKQVARINTKINGNSWNLSNFYFNIVFDILGPDDEILDSFKYDEVSDSNYYEFVLSENLPTGYYDNYKIKVTYDNGSYYTNNTDTLEQLPERESIQLTIHDKYNESGFVVLEDLYVDFSESPKIEYIDYNRIGFSFYLHNESSINLDNKIFIVDSNGSFYESRLLSDNYDNTYNGRLEFEIYNLDYKKEYEINILIKDSSLGFNVFYLENLFSDETITTKDKYPNIMIFNYILFVIIFIFLIVTPYFLYESTKMIF